MGSEFTMLLVRFHHKFKTRATEWLFATFLTLWGVMLFAVPTMFVGPAGNQYVQLAVVFPQQVWAAGCFFMGLTRLIALYINGARQSTPYIRMFTAFLSCFFWYEISLGLFVSGIPTTSWAIYPVVLAFEMYNVFRASSDAREVYDDLRAGNNGRGRNK